MTITITGLTIYMEDKDKTKDTEKDIKEDTRVIMKDIKEDIKNPTRKYAMSVNSQGIS